MGGIWDLNPSPYGHNVMFLPDKLIPPLLLAGLEPTPYGLQNQRSTIKLKELCV
jgi:hypothetical protein